jgi:polyisoprenoid-binding protein YceI
MKSLPLLFLNAGLASAVAHDRATAVEVYGVDKDHSQVTFQVRHMLSRTRGRFTDFDGTIRFDAEHPESSSVEFRVRAASIDTDNAQRDEHLRSGDFFHAERHPEVVFRSDGVKRLARDRYEVAGTLSLRGVEKRLVLPVTFLGTAKDPWGNLRAGFATEAVLNRKDFGMLWNAALDNGGFILGDDVTVTIELETVRQAEPS